MVIALLFLPIYLREAMSIATLTSLSSSTLLLSPRMPLPSLERERANE